MDPAEFAAEAAGWAAEYAGEVVAGLVATTRKLVNKAREAKAKAPDMGREQIAEILAPGFSKARSVMIAITETTSARSGGVMLYASLLRVVGLAVTEVWETQEDERVCPVCGELHDTTKDVWGVDYPGGPPAHPNCRCRLRLEWS